MTILRIEHPVRDYEIWKEAFDADPVGRERSGVRRHQVMRPVDDPVYVLIDLEFDSAREAEELLSSMRVVWERVSGVLISDPRARIVEATETKVY